MQPGVERLGGPSGVKGARRTAPPDGLSAPTHPVRRQPFGRMRPEGLAQSRSLSTLSESTRAVTLDQLVQQGPGQAL